MNFLIPVPMMAVVDNEPLPILEIYALTGRCIQLRIDDHSHVRREWRF